MKPSFILNRHVIFVLYSTEFQEISFRGRVRFCLVFWFGANIIALQKWCSLCMRRTCSPVDSVFDLKFFRCRFDPAQEPSLCSFLVLFFFSVDLLSVNLSLFSVSIIATWEKREKTKTISAVQLRRNVWGLVGKVNFLGENTIILNANRLWEKSWLPLSGHLSKTDRRGWSRGCPS